MTNKPVLHALAINETVAYISLQLPDKQQRASAISIWISTRSFSRNGRSAGSVCHPCSCRSWWFCCSGLMNVIMTRSVMRFCYNVCSRASALFDWPDAVCSMSIHLSSPAVRLVCGIPTRLMLGPVLFILYAAGLPALIRGQSLSRFCTPIICSFTVHVRRQTTMRSCRS